MYQLDTNPNASFGLIDENGNSICELSMIKRSRFSQESVDLAESVVILCNKKLQENKVLDDNDTNVIKKFKRHFANHKMTDFKWLKTLFPEI